MKKFAVLLAVIVAGFSFAACGGNEPVTPDTLAAAMDDVCTSANADFEAMGTRGLDLPGIASEYEGTAVVRQGVIDGLSGIDADQDAQKLLDSYVAASNKIVEQDKAIAKAAADGDQAAVNAAFGEQNSAFAERDTAAKEIGTKVCGQDVDIRVEPTGTAPPGDLKAVEPTNTVDAIAASYVKNGAAGDCAASNADRHTDAGELSADQCKSVQAALTGGKVAGTESYGPVAQAEIIGDQGMHLATYFVTDLDGNLRYGGDAIHDSGGLRPAPEGNDAEATAKETVTAIRDNDAAAFNATLTSTESPFKVKGDGFETFGSGKFVKDFVGDIRNGDAEPVQLGLNSTYGFYFLPGEKYDWVITMIHTPGIGGKYRFAGYYPVPKA